MFIRRREFLLLGIITLLAFSAASGQTRQWKTYDGTRYGFRVVFPSSPTVSTERVKDIPITGFEAAGTNERFEVIVTVADPNVPKDQAMKDLVGSTRKGLIDGGFRIASETDLSRGDVLGREMIYTNGTILSVTRWYFTGQSIYVVTADVLRESVVNDPVYARQVTAFINSFKTIYDEPAVPRTAYADYMSNIARRQDPPER